jgi:hypothetical protein
LLEIPLIIMESTLAQTVIDAEGQATPESMATIVQSLLRRCAAVHGVFTLLFHNAALYSPGLARFYDLTLETVSGKTKYDWPRARRECWSTENWKLAG